MLRQLIISLAVFSSAQVVWAEPAIRVAVAANFRPTLQLLATQYQQQSGQKVVLSAGSTGTLFNQIKHGAPYDIFFSADHKTAVELSSENHRAQVYALGRLVLWCPRDDLSALQLREENFFTWYVDGAIAIANPALAPYGLAAEQTLARRTDAAGTAQPMTNNVAQVAQLVVTGHARCGFIAQALLPENTPTAQWFAIPDTWYTPITQSAVVLAEGDHGHETQAFLNFVLEQGQALIRAAGYHTPNAPFKVANITQPGSP